MSNKQASADHLLTTPIFPEGHWDTEEGAQVAADYATKTRADLAMGHLTDFALANGMFLASRNDLRLVAFQTAAKERIRWLSTRLALQHTPAAEDVVKAVARIIDPAAWSWEPDMTDAAQVEGIADRRRLSMADARAAIAALQGRHAEPVMIRAANGSIVPLVIPEAAESAGEAQRALNGYRAAVSYISADSWDGCSDCIEILRAARSADYAWDWAADTNRIAAELKAIRPFCKQEIPEQAAGTGRWRERWFGSAPQKGASIVTEGGDTVAHLGSDRTQHVAAREIVRAHNAAIAALQSRPAETAQGGCANCHGMIDDLASGRDPEELCDTCYRDLMAAKAAEPAAMNAEEHWLENLKQMAAYTGPVVSFEVRQPYYLASCDHCGWVGSSELCGTDSFGDDSDVYCPRCQTSGADCGKVAERIPAAPAAAQAQGEG